MRWFWVVVLAVLALTGCDSGEGGGSAGTSGGAGASGGDGDGDGDGDSGASGGAGDSGGDGDGDGDTCDVTAPTECPSDMPTYDDVQPIFEERCVVCHSGGASELCPTCWPLNTYGHIADWSNEVRGVMLSCSMPPADSGRTIPDSERMKILEWIRCGLPR